MLYVIVIDKRLFILSMAKRQNKLGHLPLGGPYILAFMNLKVRLHRQCGPAILPSDAISIENILSPGHRFEMDIPFEIYAPRN
jgi:hypothetical protein